MVEFGPAHITGSAVLGSRRLGRFAGLTSLLGIIEYSVIVFLVFLAVVLLVLLRDAPRRDSAGFVVYPKAE